MADDASTRSTAPTSEGLQLLQDPLLNRGTAFTEAERDELGLRGLLPPQVETLAQQADRAWRSVEAVEGTPATSRQLAQHITLRQLQDTNEVLFYEVLSRHVEEALPLVYTPTVGAACQRFSQIYRRPRGLFVSYPDRHRLREVLRNRPRAEVDVIVVTDGQRILGLGDQGVGGMGIPIGKLSLYTAIGGIDPARTLPIVLDVGCDDDKLRDDPLYLGWRHPRVTGQDYDDFVDAFVTAVREELPDVLLQWEDFASKNALPILDRYRDRLLTFNDDIQGTAAVVAGAMTGAASVCGTPLRDQRIVMVGAGSAGIGVCDRLVQAMVADGAEEDDAVAAVHVLDVGGLLVEGQAGLTDAQARYAKSREQLSGWGVDTEHRSELDLMTVVRNVEPTALIGLSSAHGIFTREVVTEMASHVERPIVFPLSNPTSRSEAEPQDLSDWTDGRALVATGSPFPPVGQDGARRRVAQCNNVYVFPAVGLGVVASRATRVTDAMLLQAALALGEQSPVRHDPDGALLPEVADWPPAALAIAEAVARQAVADGVAPEATDEEVAAAVRAARWTPAYR